MEEIVLKYKNIPILYKMLVLLALLGGSGYLSYTDNIEPAFAELATAKAEQEQITNQIQALSAKRKNTDDIQIELRTAEEELMALMESLPPDPELEKTLGNIAAIAKETSIQLIDFVPVKITSSNVPVASPIIAAGVAPGSGNTPLGNVNELVQEVRFSATLVGPFSQTMMFLDRALSLPRVMKIEKFDITPVNGNKLGAEPLVTTKVDFLTYSQRLKIVLSSPAKNQTPATKSALQDSQSKVTLSSTSEKSGNKQ